MHDDIGFLQRLPRISLSTFGPLIALILVYGFFALLNAKIL
jgi:hypothetical protein